MDTLGFRRPNHQVPHASVVPDLAQTVKMGLGYSVNSINVFDGAQNGDSVYKVFNFSKNNNNSLDPVILTVFSKNPYSLNEVDIIP